jgi:hypothetical protein
MKLDRRIFIVATAGLAACGEQPPKDVRDHAKSVRDILTTHFGKDVAGSPAAQAFALALGANRQAPCLNPWAACDTPEARVLLNFLESTNYLAHAKTGEELTYFATYDPYATPCASRLVIPA